MHLSLDHRRPARDLVNTSTLLSSICQTSVCGSEGGLCTGQDLGSQSSAERVSEGYMRRCSSLLDNTVLSKCQGIDNKARTALENTSNPIRR